MELFSHQQELTSRSEEFDDSLGVGRLYECVFCRRGFNTAQALGGHMNIHRRDKVKKNKSSSKYYHNKPEEEEEEEKNHHQFSQRFYQNIVPASSSYYNHDHFVCDHDDHHQQRSTYNTKRFPGSTSYYHDDHKQYEGGQQQHRGSEDLLLHGDWNVSLSLDYNSSKAMMSQKDDLDLELRLGL